MHDGGSIPAHIFSLLNNSTKLLMGCDGTSVSACGRGVTRRKSVCSLLLSLKEPYFCLLQLINEKSLWFAQVNEFPIGMNHILTSANLQFDLRYCHSSGTTCAVRTTEWWYLKSFYYFSKWLDLQWRIDLCHKGTSVSQARKQPPSNHPDNLSYALATMHNTNHIASLSNAFNST